MGNKNTKSSVSASLVPVGEPTQLAELDNSTLEVVDSDKMPEPKTRRGKRGSISAEVYGEYNKRPEFVPKVHEKTPEQIEQIDEMLAKSFLFHGLVESDLKIVCDAFFMKQVPAGEIFIMEGDQGDELYLINSGEAEVTHFVPSTSPDHDGEVKVLATVKDGDVVGELALMYSAPRGATVTAKTDCSLWTLDRDTFTFIVQDAVRNRRERYEKFLSSVPLLQSMHEYERSKIADSVDELKFSLGSSIITQGDRGDTFYILVEGEAEILIDGKSFGKYGNGDYFGEIALINNSPRAATVKAVTDCSVVVLQKDAFTRLLGPVERILQRNMENYSKVVDKLMSKEN